MAFDYSDPNLRRPIFGPGAGFGGTQATQLAQSPGPQAATTGATAGGSVPQQQFADRIAAGQRPGPQVQQSQNQGVPSWYHFTGQVPGPPPVEQSNVAALAAWDPAMHPGRTRPTPHQYRAGHDFGPGMDWSKFYNAGNMGMSAPGSRNPTGGLPVTPTDPDWATSYWWMNDPSVQWGGGPGGYLPIGYQPQSYDYYANPQGRLAPWEGQYMRDTWTQNYDPSAPGYINTRDPSTWPNARG